MQHVACGDGEDDKACKVENKRWVVAFEKLVQKALLVRQSYLPGKFD